jgi:hypothetical protein
MKKNTKIERLNQIFSDSFTEESLLDNYIYLTKQRRGRTCTERGIKQAYRNGNFAQLLKKLDPIAYNLEN